MTDNILIGEGKGFRHEPEKAWRAELETVLRTPSPRLAFMTREHHLVRDLVVTEVPRYGAPLPPAYLAEKTGLSLVDVERIVDELETALFFLSRNTRGEVSWAYPVTAEPTPHRVTLSSGESIFAA